MADPSLTPSAKIVAYAIGQHINRQSGEAFPGTDRIAACIAMSQATVIEMVRRLEAAGHLGVDPGAPGRGHSNRYRMIRKPQLAKVFGSSKPQPAKVSAKPGKPQSTGLKPQPAKIKPQPADMNHLITTLTTKKSAPTARSTARVERGDVTETETAAVDAPLNPAFTTSDAAAVPEPLIPVPRAAGAARREPLANQPTPCRASSEMGAVANADAAPGFDAMRRLQFENVKYIYPPDRIGDDDEAYHAFCAAIAARGHLRVVIDAVKNLTLENGADVPCLAEALVIIERNS